VTDSVTKDRPALNELSVEEYYSLKKENRLFEVYPEATGLFWLDCAEEHP